MNKTLLSLLLISATAFGQIKFEKGYFIDNSGNRTDCLIRNADWNDTPSQFDYRLSEDAATLSKKDSEVSEFSVGDSKFISINIDMDFSTDWTDRLSLQKNPEFENVRIFMKQLVDGNAKLYKYSRNDLKRFFFRIGNGPVKQLVYKRYYPDNTRFVAVKNQMFRQQLLNEVKCATDENALSKLEKINYMQDELVDYFESVNKCDGSHAEKTEKKMAKGNFNLSGSVIFGMHSLGFDGGPAVSGDYGKKAYVTFGAELEYIFPFLGNKWSIIFEPSFNSYKGEIENDTEKSDVKYSYISAAAGFRYYSFLTDNTKLFFNAGLHYSQISGSSRIDFSAPSPNYPNYVFGDNNFVFFGGIGINYRKVSGEFRVQMKSNPTPYSTGVIEYNYNNFSLIGRYQFL